MFSPFVDPESGLIFDFGLIGFCLSQRDRNLNRFARPKPFSQHHVHPSVTDGHGDGVECDSSPRATAMVLTAAVLGGFFGDNVPPGHGILAYMGSAAPPIGRNDGRTVLELKVRDPWSWQGDPQHDTRRVAKHDVNGQDVPLGGGGRTTLRGSGQDAKVPTTSRGFGRGTSTLPRSSSTNNYNIGGKPRFTMGKHKPSRSWVTLDGTKPGRIKNKGLGPKATRAKQSARADGQELGEVEAKMSIKERTAAVTLLARNTTWKRKAREELEEGFYSGNTSASKDSKRKKITDLAEACVGRGKVFPVELTTLLDVAALLRKINMKASEQYLYELKAMNAELGFGWSSQMEAHFKMCKRSLTRDRGPEDRALELKPQEIQENVLYACSKSRIFPKRIGLSFVWAATWMLRAIEAQGVKVSHVTVDHECKTVKLWIPKSKMDQRALGVSRTLGCECKGKCRNLCPYNLAVVSLVDHSEKRAGAFLFPTSEGAHVAQFNLVKSWNDHLKQGVSGHSARRSGAMMYARGGMSVQEIAYLGRWKSSAVFRYIEQALQDVPLNITGKFNHEVRQERQNSDEEVNKNAKVKIINKGMTEKVDNLAGRVKALEDAPRQNAEQKPPKQLWAISNVREQRRAHMVTQASWNLPLESWATACGWRFAKKSVKVNLTREIGDGLKVCEKCHEHQGMRDDVKCGISLAQLVDI